MKNLESKIDIGKEIISPEMVHMEKASQTRENINYST